MIPEPPAPAPATGSRTPKFAQRPADQDPKTFWDRHFREPEADLDDLLVNLAYLRTLEQFQDVQAALRAFLEFHGAEAQPWMYEMLAVALTVNKGKPADINTALGYAANLAVRNARPHELTRIADTLAIHGQNDRAGALLDQAAELDPGWSIPWLMSLSLAERTRDPVRMATAVEGLLALGWPEEDEQARAETRRRVEALAATLREEGRSEEASDLLERLARSETRDLFVRLSWAGDADLSLVVNEPLGAVARVASPRTVFGGALVRNGFGSEPEEVYVCPRAFDGDYTLRVEVLQSNPDDPARDVTLEVITHEGTPDEQTERHPVALPDPEPVVVHLKNGRRTSVLPYQAPPRPAMAAESAPASPSPSPSPAPAPAPSAADAANALRPPAAGSAGPR